METKMLEWVINYVKNTAPERKTETDKARAELAQLKMDLKNTRELLNMCTNEEEVSKLRTALSARDATIDEIMQAAKVNNLPNFLKAIEDTLAGCPEYIK